MSKSSIRVRFAPSPTGHLHIGSVRVAIFNWLFARHEKGIFLVRIEDTDVQRSKQEYVDSILKSLEWLDLMPDEEIVYQLSRVDEHKKYINYLLEKGLAYPCFCEPKQADQVVKDLEKGVASHYDGTCRNKSYTKEDLQRPHAIRFKIPKDLKQISFDDVIRGNITVDTDLLDDFVILRRDGTPTYNFCVVIDDIAMKISHVIRGEDHISNTPKQILLYQALGEDIPQFAHLPLILGPAGNKLSKRDAAVSVVEYKEQGFLPDALFNYLVRLGWSHGDQEVFNKKELVELFKLDKIGKKGAIFDTKKLLWLNGLYIRNLSYKDFIQAVSAQIVDKLKRLTVLWDEATLKKLFELYKERASTLCELVEDMISFAQVPVVTKDICSQEPARKWVTAQTPALLQEFIKRTEQMEDYNHDAFLSLAKNICNEYDTKLVFLAQPLRLALTGKTCSPGVFELLAILSWQESKKRIQKLITLLQEY